MTRNAIGVGLLGLGTVGGAVAEAITSREQLYAERAGLPLTLRRAVVRDLAKERSPALRNLPLTTDIDEVLDDPEVRIVVEVIGGEQPARDLIRRALLSGRHVVTANKEVIAKHGGELRSLAAERGLAVRYEASVGGGIPIITLLERDLAANEITRIAAIINGTTNYMLTRMAREHVTFEQALAQAQALGYAEPDPRNDVEGIDAAYKLAILASLAYGAHVPPERVHYEGIRKLEPRDFRYAEELGYAIKLLAVADHAERGVRVRVHPALVSSDAPLAKVDGVFNAIQIEGDLLGPILLQGRGAGPEPTASAVVADIVDVARTLRDECLPRTAAAGANLLETEPMDTLSAQYYVRMTVADSPGVLASVAHVFGEESISIASVIQKEADEVAGTAEIVIMTHHARERSLQSALRTLGSAEPVREIGNCLRVAE
ncbi:MAG TPA: homoserine dehydrogenase [Dehalococcoidia bacterium]|nr:homoserine dehydrogenase [Dehalococcoidia bacterium]